MESTNQALRAGTILNGDQYTYRIERILGQGAFGITYLATTEIVGKFGRLPVKVALKEYFAKELNSRAEDGSVREASSESLAGRYGKAFQREALNLSHLEHPGIVSVLEAFAANNTWYYAMEYIEGGSLDEYIVRRGGLPEQEAVVAIREIGSALSFMHDHKMLHLDLKPKNIMRREDGRLVLIDFGLSKQYAADGEAESSTTIGLGTPGYAPLEQSQLGSGKFFSPSLDVYALAATLFKMLSGKTPPNSSEVFNLGFPEGNLRARGISENVIYAIEKGMAPQQIQRPQRVAEFLALLNGPVASTAEEVEEETTVISKPEAIVPEAESSQELFPRVTAIYLIIGLLVGVLACVITVQISLYYVSDYENIRYYELQNGEEARHFIHYFFIWLPVLGALGAELGLVLMCRKWKFGFWLLVIGSLIWCIFGPIGECISTRNPFNWHHLWRFVVLLPFVYIITYCVLQIKNKNGVKGWDQLKNGLPGLKHNKE